MAQALRLAPDIFEAPSARLIAATQGKPLRGWRPNISPQPLAPQEQKRQRRVWMSADLGRENHGNGRNYHVDRFDAEFLQCAALHVAEGTL